MEKHKGFEKAIFVEDGHVDPKYCCSICLLILDNPYQSSCGHRFCKECVLDKIRNEPSGELVCPACSLEDDSDEEPDNLSEDTVYPDKAILRELAKKPVKCINNGCDWKDIFRGYQKHVQECAFRPVQCDDCGQVLVQSRLALHKENECSHRIVTCEYCQQQYPFHAEQEHEKACPLLPVCCEACKNTMSREQLPFHQARECDMVVRPCDYSIYGCDAQVTREQQHVHEKENLVVHLKFLKEYVEKFDNQTRTFTSRDEISTLRKKLDDLVGQIGSLKLSDTESKPTAGSADNAGFAAATGRNSPVSRDLIPEDASAQKDGAASSKNKAGGKGAKRKGKKQPAGEDSRENSIGADVAVASGSSLDSGDANLLEALKQQAETFTAVSQVLKREVEQMRGRTDTLERQKRLDQDQIRALEQKIAVLERQLQGKDQVLSQLTAQLQAAENVSHNGILTWRIGEVARRRREAISGQVLSLFSPPFFTGPTGYKMCARIYLNGDGMGRGSHVSMFFALMKGSYDAILQWPFTQKVTLLILDQRGRENAIDRFRPDPTTSSFSRPTENMNVASGCPLFLALSSLEDSTKGYVKDDALFVRIEVDTSGLQQ